MKGPPAVTEALSTSDKNMEGPPIGNKTTKGLHGSLVDQQLHNGSYMYMYVLDVPL